MYLMKNPMTRKIFYKPGFVTNSIAALLFVSAALFISCTQSNHAASGNEAVSLTDIRIKVGNAPGCVEAAIINKDKFPDLVISSEQDSSVTILLGDSTGKFTEAPGSPFPAGNGVNDIAIADYNQDGSADLAFANHERKYITVLSGDGNGGFAAAPSSPFPVEAIPHTHGVATGDFNSDGQPDLVTESWGNNEVAVLFGKGRDGFKTPATFFKVGQQPYQRLRVADVNNDGKDDIITTNLEGDNVTVLLSEGNGTFNEPAGSPFPCGNSPFNVAIGDVNADGKPDLAIINSPASTGKVTGINGLTVLIGEGTGKFTMMKGSPFPAGDIPNRVAIGDVDGDGVNDIVASDNNSDKITLFIMGKNGNVSADSMITVGNHPKGVAISDLNGDGKGEIVVCNNADNDISIVSYK
jgi:hypothetical protein